MNAPRVMSQLDEQLAKVRAMLNTPAPITARIRLLWAWAKNSRELSAADVIIAEFTRLAIETGVHADLGRHADEDLEHVLRWALLNRNPFQ